MRRKAPKLTFALLVLMTVSIGVAVSVNYYVQPLLPTISADLDISLTGAAFIVTLTHLGVAAGLLILLPLGDMLEKKRLIITLLVVAVYGVLQMGYAESYIRLTVGAMVTGVFSVAAWLLLPFATGLAEPGRRGRILSLLMGGFTVGVLLARAYAGALSYIGGWQAPYVMSAGVLGVCTLLFGLLMPPYPATVYLKYPDLLKSVFFNFKKFPALRLKSATGAFTMGGLAALWTSVAFMLRDSYAFSDLAIGLSGLAGALGVLCAPAAGRLAEKERTGSAETVGLVCSLLAWMLIFPAKMSVLALIAGMVLLDTAVQLVNVTNLNDVLKLDTQAVGRLTSGYMFCCYLGAGAGSALSALLYGSAGWYAACAAGAAFSLAGLAIRVFLSPRKSLPQS